MDETELQEYITRIKNGDSAPYAFIVDEYKYMAYTIALRIVSDAADADDVAQESFIKAYQQIHQFEGKAKFSTWLYTIVYRTALSRIKERRLDTRSINDTLDEHYTRDHSASPHERMEIEEERMQIKRVIQNLPQTESVLVTLYYINENSVREICQITGLSVANVKIRLFRVRKRLERELSFLMKGEIASHGEE